MRKAVLAQRSCPWPAGKSWCGCVAGDAWGRGCYARVGEGLWGALGVPPLLPGVGWAMVFAWGYGKAGAGVCTWAVITPCLQAVSSVLGRKPPQAP